MSKINHLIDLSKIGKPYSLKTLSGTYTIPVSPYLAEEWLMVNTINRKPSLSHIKKLASSMKNGKWRLNGETIIFSKCGRLIDGQHRLYAVIESGVTIKTDVRFGIDSDVMPTINEGKKRSAGDVYKMNGIPNYNTAAAAVKMVYQYDTGRFGSSGAATQNLSNPEALEWYGKNPNMEEATILGVKLYNLGAKMVLSKSKFAGYYFIMSRIDESLSWKFCESLATGANLGIGSPIYKLRSELLRASMDKRRRLTHKAIHELVVWTWNNIRDGKSPKIIRIIPKSDGSHLKLK